MPRPHGTHLIKLTFSSTVCLHSREWSLTNDDDFIHGGPAKVLQWLISKRWYKKKTLSMGGGLTLILITFWAFYTIFEIPPLQIQNGVWLT